MKMEKGNIMNNSWLKEKIYTINSEHENVNIKNKENKKYVSLDSL